MVPPRYAADTRSVPLYMHTTTEQGMPLVAALLAKALESELLKQVLAQGSHLLLDLLKSQSLNSVAANVALATLATQASAATTTSPYLLLWVNALLLSPFLSDSFHRLCFLLW